MQFWDNIVHTALLGTDKRQLKKEDFPEDLADTIELIHEQEADKEARFLHLASVLFNYRKCGIQAINKSLVFSTAEEETRPYCSSRAHELFGQIISVESFPLLKFWVELCSKAGYIVQPEYIPVLFDSGMTHKELKSAVLAVAGKRGEWLTQYNPAWKVDVKTSGEDIWETGTLEERKIFLKELRRAEPSRARDLLQKVWAQENANSKTELVKSLAVNISDEDVSWLEQLQEDKSQKVRDEALQLLKLCKGSSIVKNYSVIVRQSIHVKNEKRLLGFGSRTTVDIQLTGKVDEAIFKSGIEKITSEKNVPDDDFILYQLIAAVPPSVMEDHLGLDKEQIIDLFLQDKKGKQVLTAFGLAAITFKEVDWLRAIIAVSQSQFYPEAFALLPAEEAETYALTFLGQEEDAKAIIDYLARYHRGVWSMKLTRQVFQEAVKDPYTFNRSFYHKVILSIPAAIIPELETYAPAEAHLKSIWTKTSEYLVQLLTLKTQIGDEFPL